MSPVPGHLERLVRPLHPISRLVTDHVWFFHIIMRVGIDNVFLKNFSEDHAILYVVDCVS